MDTLAAFLDGPRAREAFLLKSVMQPPWSLRICDEAPLTLIALVIGEAWVLFDDAPPVHLTAGDVAVIAGPRPYTVADDPSTEPSVIIGPGQTCTALNGESVAAAMDLGVRTFGNSAVGSTTMLTGTYTTDGEISRRLLDALPRSIVVRHDARSAPLIAVLADEIESESPGQAIVLDRLLDLLLIGALRTWFSDPETVAPAWFDAHSDPVVGRALRLIHNEPAHPWSLVELASTVGVSRAALARRFHEAVGEPPMTFLANWRLALAADLLRDRHRTVSAVSREVGYASPFTFSTAFKRTYGISPRAHRERTVVTARGNMAERVAEP